MFKEAKRVKEEGITKVIVGRTGKSKTAEGYLFTDEPRTVRVGQNNFGDEKCGEALVAIAILIEEGKMDRAETAIAVYESVGRNATEVGKGGRAMLAAARKVAAS